MADKAFLNRAIRALQSPSSKDAQGGPPTQVLHEYVDEHALLAWDDKRALFWVETPDDGWQVALWLMPAALEFEPQP